MSASEIEILQAQIDALNARLTAMETRLADRDALEQQIQDAASSAAMRTLP